MTDAKPSTYWTQPHPTKSLAQSQRGATDAVAKIRAVFEKLTPGYYDKDAIERLVLEALREAGR